MKTSLRKKLFRSAATLAMGILGYTTAQAQLGGLPLWTNRYGDPDGFGGYFLSFEGVSGSAYRLQRAPSLSGPWATSSPQTAPTSGLLEFWDLFPPLGQRFYRSVAP